MKLLRLLLILVSLLYGFSLRANHVLGGNITWECVGVGQYEITFTLYKDCYGTPGDPLTESMYFYPSGCASFPFTADLDFVSATEISDLCATELLNSSCAGGFQPGTSQVVYSGIITLPANCVWQAIWNNGDWNYFGNMNAVPQNAFINSFIDTSQPCGDSPDITSNPADPQVPYICLNSAFSMTLPITNAAGYTLTYSLGSCLTTGASVDVPINASGYTAALGLTLVGNQINWTPTVLGNFAVCIDIEIYNGINYVGTINENMCFVVRNCVPTVTSFDIPQVTSVGPETTLTGNNNISVCVGDSIVFTVEANNSVLTRGITLSYTPIGALPFTFTQSGLNPAVGTFSLLATGAMVTGSPHVLNINALDDACPNPDTDDIVVNITVSPNISLLTNDTTICFGQPVNLSAFGLSNTAYNWNVLAGGDNAPAPANGVASQNVTPDFTTSYRVSAVGIPASCASSDTVVVTVAMTDLTLNAMSETCSNNNGAIDLTVLGNGSGNYDYQWTGINSVDLQQDQFGLNGGVGQNYSVTVTDNVFNCSLTESVNVADVAQPTLVFHSDTTICAGGSATLLVDFTAGVAPFDIDFLTTPADVINVPDGFTFVMSPAATSTYTIANVTDNSGCTAAINQAVTVTVRQPVTSNFLPEADICVGANLILDINHNQAGSYSVVYSINGVNEPAPVVVADNGTINVTDPAINGTFTYDIESVSYNDAPLPSCPSTDLANPSIQVIVDPLPTAVLTGNATICAGDCYDQIITLTGTGPWIVGYTLNGLAQPALNIPIAIAPHNYTWNVCAAATATYCITSVQDANCTNAVAGECAIITVAPLPVVNFSIADTELCLGDCASINVTVAPAGTFTIEFSELPNDVGLASTSALQNSPFNNAICPLVTTNYCLDSVFYTGVPQCAAVLNQCITVNVNGDIAVTAIDTICDNTSSNYQVVYQVTGGEQLYYEDPAGDNGNFDVTNTLFTTNPTLSGVGNGPWIFGDNNDCNSVAITMAAYTCPLLSNAGTMVLTPISLCGNGAATATWNNNGFLDGNDQQMFILHTTSGNTLGTVISTDCNDASFGDVDSPLAFGLAAANGVIVSGVTYYISSVVGDDSNGGIGGCVATAAPNVQISPGTPVVWNAFPQVVYTIADTELCNGDCATINVTVAPASPFTIQFSETPSDPILGQAIGQNSPFDYIVCPGVTTDYCLDSVYFSGAPQCATVSNQCITVNVNGDIAVVPIDTICNNISTQYQVVYEITGGEQQYYEDATGDNGTFDVTNTLFTTDATLSGLGNGPWIFGDNNDCNSVAVSMNAYTCPVITESGTMSNQLLSICGGTVTPNTASGIFNNDAVLDANDQQMFILHTTADFSLGTVISTDCDDANFGDADSPLSYGALAGPGVIVSGTTYYISSVAGDDSNGGIGGCVATAAPNVQISIGQPVIWYQAATATLSAVAADSVACQGQTVSLQVVLTGQGPWTVGYTIDNVAQSVIVPVGGSPYIFNVAVGGDYCLTTVNNSIANCPGTVSGCVQVIIHPLPTAILSGAASTCAGTNHCFDIDFTGQTPWGFTMNDPDGIDDVVAPTANDPYQYCVGVAGPYQIMSVSDGNGCVNNTAGPIVNLVVNVLPTIQWTFPTDTSFCEGSCIDLTMASTGTPTFDVTITSPDPNITTASLQNIGQVYTITICEPGDYILLDVTDNNGCVSAGGDIISVVEIATPVVDAGPDLDQCVGLPIMIGTPAVAGQTYNWVPTTGMGAGQPILAEPTVTINVANTYNYTVSAAVAQCSASDQMTLTIHALPGVIITPDDAAICFDTCTDLVASGADSYVWDPSASITTALNNAAVTICPGITETFSVIGFEVHNAIQCEASETVEITVGEELLLVLDYSDEICFGTCDGFANFELSGGFEPYTVNGDFSLIWTDLCAGTNNYSILDAQGCSIDDSFDIAERPEEFINQVLTVNPICFGDVTGSIQLIDPAATSFSLDAPLGVPDVLDDSAPFIFENLPAGDYVVTMAVEVAPGIVCNADSAITLVSMSPAITIILPWSQESFCLGDEVCYETILDGGFGVLTTSWNTCEDAVGCQISNADPFCLTITQDSTLYVYGIDENSCSTDTLAVTASLFPDITVSFLSTIDTVICQFDCTELIVEVAGGNGNVFVDWYEIPVDNNPFYTGDTVTVCPFVDTDYWIEASDGCSASVRDTINIRVHETPIVLLETDTLEGCFPATIQFYDLSLPLVDNHSCLWSFGNNVSLSFCGDTSYAYPSYGEFYPSLTITTEYGCVGTDTLIEPVVIHGYPEIDFTWEPQPVTVLEHQVQFINETTGAISYNWNFYLTETSQLTNPTWDFPDIEQATFPVCLEATSVFGCVDTVCQDIYIESILLIFVPNTFTPDGDGINDIFLPQIAGVKPGSYKFWIFNRWGDQVFYTDDPERAWTGGKEAGTFYIEDGTYVWRMECESLQDGRVEVFEGHVNILR